jgi:uncharacterized lipoprotein YmbA
MARSLWFRWRWLLLGIGLAAGWGCGSTAPAKFYTLSPLPAMGERASGKEAADRGLAVGIGPIRLPLYLVRPEIVTRTDANKIEVAELDLWGGSLQDDFSRNLLENLSFLLAGDRVSLYLLPGVGAVDYRVAVDVIRFDGVRGRDVVLIAGWTIRSGLDSKTVRVGNSRILEPTGGENYEAMVGGMSRALGRLSREIGEAIKALPR